MNRIAADVVAFADQVDVVAVAWVVVWAFLDVADEIELSGKGRSWTVVAVLFVKVVLARKVLSNAVLIVIA